MDVAVGAVLFIVVIAFVVERGIELILDLLGRLPGLIRGEVRESRLEARLVAHLLGFSAGVVLSEWFHLDLVGLVSGEMVDTADWIVNGVLVAWSADFAHQAMKRWLERPTASMQ